MAKPTRPTSTSGINRKKLSAEEIMRIRMARAWKPEVNDEIEGTIVVILKRSSDYGDYPVVVLDCGDPDHLIAVHAYHGVLLDGLREMKAAPGMSIRIGYYGKIVSKNDAPDGTKRKYNGYCVVPTDGAELESLDFSGDEAPF